MPEDKSPDAVEKFLQEQKAIEARKEALIEDLLKQRAEAIKSFDDKLALLGYNSSTGKRKRSHHKAPAPETGGAPKTKTKA